MARSEPDHRTGGGYVIAPALPGSKNKKKVAGSSHRMAGSSSLKSDVSRSTPTERDGDRASWAGLTDPSSCREPSHNTTRHDTTKTRQHICGNVTRCVAIATAGHAFLSTSVLVLCFLCLFRPGLPCYATPCYATPRHAMPCHAMSKQAKPETNQYIHGRQNTHTHTHLRRDQTRPQAVRQTAGQGGLSESNPHKEHVHRAYPGQPVTSIDRARQQTH